MRTFFILFFSIFVLTSNSKAQLFDSIQTSFNYKPKLLLKLDSRNSFIANQYAKTQGVKIGINFNKTTSLGFGYHWMNTRKVEAFNSDLDSVNLNLGYGVAFFEYAFYKSKRWTAEIPVQIGIGRASYSNLDNKAQVGKSWILIYEPAMTIEYRFLRYFGIGGGVGFRLSSKTNKEIKERFTAPEYLFRFKIYFGDIYKEQILKE